MPVMLPLTVEENAIPSVPLALKATVCGTVGNRMLALLCSGVTPGGGSGALAAIGVGPEKKVMISCCALRQMIGLAALRVYSLILFSDSISIVTVCGSEAASATPALMARLLTMILPCAVSGVLRM